jgi:hypothetical protein
VPEAPTNQPSYSPERNAAGRNAWLVRHVVVARAGRRDRVTHPPGIDRAPWRASTLPVRGDKIDAMRLGIADHLGWAVAVTAAADHHVVDRRRIELVEPGMTRAPIHYESHRLGVAATAALVAEVRGSVVRATAAALDEIEAALRVPIMSISLRAWPRDFPDDIAVQRRSPHEARADAIMYRRILSDLGRARSYHVHTYNAKTVEAQAVSILAERAEEVLNGPRAMLGPPWTRDHRVALAATIVVGREPTGNG